MKKNIQVVKGNKKQDLYVRSYRNEGTSTKVKGVILILHGMADYGDRYDGFAEFLVNHGYVIYIHDHRKHGKSVNQDQKVGYYTDDTWKDMIDDVEHIKQLAKKQEGVDTIILMGHSMGSFIVRNTLMTYGSDISKAVIIGTADTNKPLTIAGIVMAKIIGTFAGNKQSPFLDNLSIGSFNKAFKPNRTSCDWLTRDENIVDWYVANPLCGYPYTPKFYEEISKGLLYIIKPENIKKTPKIPLLFIAGALDPVGEQGKGVKKIRDIYQSLGYNTAIEIIPEARHEILNEMNKEDVYNKILSFVEN